MKNEQLYDLELELTNRDKLICNITIDEVADLIEEFADDTVIAVVTPVISDD